MKKFNQTLITLLLLISIAFVGLSCYKKIVDIQQAEFDLKYKETVNSSIEYPYDCIYRRIDRETGIAEVISVNTYSDGMWISLPMPVNEKVGK